MTILDQGVPPLRRRLRRLVHRHRRLIACLLFSAAAGVAVEAAVGDDVATTTIITAARDLPAGTVLTDADLVPWELPDEAVPPGALRQATDAVGRQVATPLLRGSPIPPTNLVGDGLLAGTPPGTVAVPLRPADPATVRLLTPGQRVDVILRTGNGYDVAADSTVLARSAAVLWTDAGAEATSWPGADAEGGLVVVAAAPGEAAALAGSSSSGDVHLILTGP
ncbi:Flp pilus assembly protein CpaB [Arthrobacter agilis]|uniref:Flp pilus assembly protein CpaB n=1 Tax=Arthrobacter agilis TaxID=37921 RepID=UPI002365DD32|nr:Flp pilus assembly protein CpaB [Arthrobacter agilis]WDF32533.1 Flp pilus assembly protein CpaB [Arthrobacter agilis]